MQNSKHIFFDLDHTLWDFERNSALAYQSVFKVNNINIDVHQFLNAYVPINLKLWKLFREDTITKAELRYRRLKETFTTINFHASDAIILKIAEDYLFYLPQNNYLLEGCIEVLDYLKPKYNLHIITNGFEEVQYNKLKKSGILSYFDVIVTSDSIGVKKPNAKIFNHALELCSAIAEESVMVGDSLEADVIGALQMNMKAIHITDNPSKKITEYICVNKLLALKQYL